MARITSIRFSLSLPASPAENREKCNYLSEKQLIWEGERDFQGDLAPDENTESKLNFTQEQSQWEYMGKD